MRTESAPSGLVVCATLVLLSGCLVTTQPGKPPCENDTICNDGLFCNGQERCVDGICQSGSEPCDSDETCDESGDRCVPPEIGTSGDRDCRSDSDCGSFCDGRACVDRKCTDAVPPCASFEECDSETETCFFPCTSDDRCRDLVVCNGEEKCVQGRCVAGTNPCDDGVACNGIEACMPAVGIVDHVCFEGESPCTGGRICDEAKDECVEALDPCASVVCEDDGDACTIESCDPATGECVSTDVICIAAYTCVNGECTPVAPAAERRDYWTTESTGNSRQDFSSQPLPPGFFDYGGRTCEGFSGAPNFEGLPLSPDTVGASDTMVDRDGDPIKPSDPIGTVGVVDVDIVGLNLRSTEPITVICDGAPTLWNVRATLSDTPAPTGTLTATKEHENGGTAETVLYVLMRLVFTNVSDPNVERVFDQGEQGLSAIDFHATMPWVHAIDPNNPDPATSFILGVTGISARQGRGISAACPDHNNPGGSHLHNTCASDTDLDGMPDSVDNCRFVFNTGQEDADGDSFGDACDECPTDPTCPRTGDECSGECRELNTRSCELNQAFATWFCGCWGCIGDQCNDFPEPSALCQQQINEFLAGDFAAERQSVADRFTALACDRCNLEVCEPTPCGLHEIPPSCDDRLPDGRCRPECGDGVVEPPERCDPPGEFCDETCQFACDDADCDDGLFCNGRERCSGFGSCLSGPIPCPRRCSEDSDSCCETDADCSAGCVTASCQDGLCVSQDFSECTTDGSCSERTICGSCTANYPCGWCDDGVGGGACRRGSSDGPNEGICFTWAWLRSECVGP